MLESIAFPVIFVHSQRNLLDLSTIVLLLLECFLLLHAFIWMRSSVLHDLTYMCTFLHRASIIMLGFGKALKIYGRLHSGVFASCIKNSVRESLLGIPFAPGDAVVKNPSADAWDMDLIPGLGRSPGKENGNPLQYSCLENPMDRGATVHEVSKSHTQLSRHSSPRITFRHAITMIFFLGTFSLGRADLLLPPASSLPALHLFLSKLPSRL